MLRLSRHQFILLLSLGLLTNCGAQTDETADESAAEEEATPPASADRPADGDINTTDETSAANPETSTQTAETQVEFTDFAFIDLTPDSVTNQSTVRWNPAADGTVVYHLLLADQADCTGVAYEFIDLTETSASLETIVDGAYYLCLEAELAGEVMAATNSGIRVAFDTTSPPTLETFNVTPKVASLPSGTTADELGTLALNLEFPADTTDYASFELRYSEQPLDDCSQGATMPLGDLEFSGTVSQNLHLSPGKTYYFRACITDDAANITAQDPTTDGVVVPGQQRVFVSSQQFTGNLQADYMGTAFATGLEGADFRCQNMAETAGLGGRWAAVLSDEATAAKDRIALYDSVVDVLGGTIKAVASGFWGDLDDGIKLAEDGSDMGTAFVWTATLEGGLVRSGATCNNWASSDSSHTGGSGFSDNVQGGTWLEGNDFTPDCTNAYRLYCIEQAAAP